MAKDSPTTIKSVTPTVDPRVVVCTTRDGNSYLVRADKNMGMLPKIGLSILGFVHEDVL